MGTSLEPGTQEGQPKIKSSRTHMQQNVKQVNMQKRKGTFMLTYSEL